METKNYYNEIFLNEKTPIEKIKERLTGLLFELNPNKNSKNLAKFIRVHEALVFLTNHYYKNYYDRFGALGMTLAIDDRALFFFSRALQPKYCCSYAIALLILVLLIPISPASYLIFGGLLGKEIIALSSFFMFISFFLILFTLFFFCRFLGSRGLQKEKTNIMKIIYSVSYVLILSIFTFLELEFEFQMWIKLSFLSIIIIDDIYGYWNYIKDSRTRRIEVNAHINEFNRKIIKSISKGAYVLTILDIGKYIPSFLKGIMIITLIALMFFLSLPKKNSKLFACSLEVLMLIYFLSFARFERFSFRLIQYIVFGLFLLSYLFWIFTLYRKWKSSKIKSRYSIVPMLTYDEDLNLEQV